MIAAIDSSTRSGLFTFVAFVMLAKGVPDGWALQAIPALLIGGMVGKLACGYLAAHSTFCSGVASGCRPARDRRRMIERMKIVKHEPLSGEQNNVEFRS